MADDRIVVLPDGTRHRFVGGASDAEISAALNAPPPSARGASKARSWTDVAVDTLPTVGGIAGGIIGGIGGILGGVGVGGVPGAIGGATLGGATGEAARQLVNRARGAVAPTSGMDAATAIGKEGAIQGASEAAGQGLMKLAGMAAHGLMDFAIRPAPSVAKEFGDIAGTAIAERVPVGAVIPGATKGSAAARAALRESGAATRGLLDAAGSAGTSFEASKVATGPVTELVGEIAKAPLSESELGHVSRMFSEFLDNHGTMTPSMLKDLKQAAQRVAKPIYRALNAGNSVPAGDALKAQFNKAVADGAKTALETIPGVAASEARTQGLIGLGQAVRQAEVRRLPLMAEMAAPIAGAVAGGAMGRTNASRGESAAGGIGTAVLVRALLSPRSTSRAALALTSPAIQELVRQLPRGAVYGILDQLQQQQQDQADGRDHAH